MRRSRKLMSQQVDLYYSALRSHRDFQAQQQQRWQQVPELSGEWTEAVRFKSYDSAESRQRKHSSQYLSQFKQSLSYVPTKGAETVRGIQAKNRARWEKEREAEIEKMGAKPQSTPPALLALGSTASVGASAADDKLTELINVLTLAGASLQEGQAFSLEGSSEEVRQRVEEWLKSSKQPTDLSFVPAAAAEGQEGPTVRAGGARGGAESELKEVVMDALQATKTRVREHVKALESVEGDSNTAFDEKMKILKRAFANHIHSLSTTSSEYEVNEEAIRLYEEQIAAIDELRERVETRAQLFHLNKSREVHRWDSTFVPPNPLDALFPTLKQGSTVDTLQDIRVQDAEDKQIAMANAEAKGVTLVPRPLPPSTSSANPFRSALHLYRVKAIIQYLKQLHRAKKRREALGYRDLDGLGLEVDEPNHPWKKQIFDSHKLMLKNNGLWTQKDKELYLRVLHKYLTEELTDSEIAKARMP